MHQFDLKNKTAIITGGAQGFGLDIAKRFLKSGTKAIIWDIDEEELKKAVKAVNDPNLSYNVVDVSVFKNVKDTVDEIAKSSNIDILINNAGITGSTSSLWDYDVVEWNKIIQINLMGTFNCCKCVVPYMIKNDYGRIVNVASVAGKDGNANASAYSSAKAGVIGLTKHLATHVAPVRVNCLVPGGILYNQDDNFLNKYSKNTPLNRMMNVSEISGIVDLLCSENSSYITGATIPIDGGWTSW
mgnify:CR=1 FL=1